jgi:uncharacterized membrane protein
MDNRALPHEDDDPTSNFVWTYRGYHLEAGNFATAMVHLYRGEITRANTWRNRLDVTTNWATVTTAAAISFAFAQPDTHHSVIILFHVLVTLFLMIEARRYRYYELWSYRVRLLETDFYAAMLVPPFQPRQNWSQNLADSLLNPQFPISFWEAVGRRLRRNYMWIYLVLGIAWFSKLLLYPEGILTVDQLIRRSAMGALSGWIVLALMLCFYLRLIVVGVLTFRFQKATGEVLTHYDVQSLKEHIKEEAVAQQQKQDAEQK